MKKLLLILLCIPLLFSNCKKEDIINNDTDCSGPDINGLLILLCKLPKPTL